MLFLSCALAIFLFGSNYKAFVTNGNVPYTAGLTAVFLIAALLLKRSHKFAKYWQIAYTFFVASAVTLVSALFAGYSQRRNLFFPSPWGLVLNAIPPAPVSAQPASLLVVPSSAITCTRPIPPWLDALAATGWRRATASRT